MYSKRSLRFEFVNETSSFDDSGNNTISIRNVKSAVSCQSSGNLFGTQVSVSIFGLSMNMLTALSSRAMGLFGTDTERISMKIFVENTAIFVGYMTSSFANMNQAPNTPLMITATASADLQNKPASPFSFNGPTTVSDIINAICKPAGYTPYITGLDGMSITNPYFEGSVFDQLQALCDHLDISMSITPPAIAFWPQKSTRDGIKPLVSLDYGMIGYPIPSSGGVMFQTQFSTFLTTGRDIRLQTIMPHLSGDYKLTGVTHELSSWIDSGPWHSLCIANRILEGVTNG
ncbi:TPA: hypothetical protein SCM97_002844 [Yersinia enterocolitica]|nr:hypothetical protein [Yersinia enterocolitica]HEG1275469.1 hypothetical protein [Yersinia enterocolitica]